MDKKTAAAVVDDTNSNSNTTTVMSVFRGLREYWTPVLSESRLEEAAVLTPAEFVAAGDYLVRKCGTWAWQPGDAAGRREYLPPNKQYLITRGVPGLRMHTRNGQREYTLDNELGLTPVPDAEAILGAGIGSDWVTTTSTSQSLQKKPPSSPPLPLPLPQEETVAAAREQVANKDHNSTTKEEEEEDDDDDIVIIGQEDEEEKKEDEEKVVFTRTYDLSIAYDKYYQTPRLYLAGYDERHRALDASTVLNDVSPDHARKTVTIETHPHQSALRVASVHPCRHAQVMKKFMDRMRDGGRPLRPEEYLVVFLKIMASVLPAINYDQAVMPFD